jgi:hypothetical protein
MAFGPAYSSAREPDKKWVATWARSMQGTLTVSPPSPYGNTPASVYGLQPDLTFPFPNGTTDGGVDKRPCALRRPTAGQIFSFAKVTSKVP